MFKKITISLKRSTYNDGMFSRIVYFSLSAKLFFTEMLTLNEIEEKFGEKSISTFDSFTHLPFQRLRLSIRFNNNSTFLSLLSTIVLFDVQCYSIRIYRQLYSVVDVFFFSKI